MKRKKEQPIKQGKVKGANSADLEGNLENWKYPYVLAFILLITILAYIPVFHNGFVWDDNHYIRDNPLVYQINLKEIFSQNVMGNYHPVTILVHAFEYQLFGLNEIGYHVVNLLLHLLNVIFVFYTVFLLSNKVKVALVASLLFGINPLHVESVAWAAELKDVLYTFFFLASYIFYLKYLKDPQKKYYIFALLLFLFSLLSKAMAASLPVIFLLTDYFMNRKFSVKTIIEKLPFFLLAFILGVVAIIAQKSSEAISDISFFTLPQRIIFACYSFVSYIYKLILPLKLSATYPYPIKSGESIPGHYYIYLFFILAIGVFVFYSLRYSKKVFFGIGFFAITVFLVLQLLTVGDAIMADRYSYIPSIGLFYLAGEGFGFLWHRYQKWIAIGILSVLALFYSERTFSRCKVWKDEITLWNDVISQYQNISKAYYNRGVAFMEQKKDAQAIDDYSKSIEVNSKFPEAYVNRANILRDNNRYAEALKDYNKATELNPRLPIIYFNRGLYFLNQDKFADAITDFTKAIDLKKNYAKAYFNRGLAKFNLGQKEEACQDLKTSITYGFNPPKEALSTICK